MHKLSDKTDGTRARKVGRRTNCTPETIKALSKLIAIPCTIKSACEATGISVAAYHDWCRRAELGEEPFKEFLSAVTRARGKGKAELVKKIVDSGDPRTWLELLARIFPDEYARTEPRVVIVQQSVSAFPPTTVTRSHEWRTKDVPAELVRYLDLLQRSETSAAESKEESE